VAAVWSKLSPPSALIFGFIARYAGGELTTSDETPELGWFTGAEALALVSNPVNRDRLATLLAFSGEITYRAYTPKPYEVREETLLSGVCADKR
jgi:NADH pyrophosphatase NudC (nudix superfamily)